ncbi:MAG: AAC(3) family N-acetyltransferase [Erysipelotrichaceae bacterium]|nr:AAC(3) family N-acetyltransferase [Erysipelotrichaceae bacterium]MDD3924037.1 AAC(3) family N-acetyltransferase [Erysipelotrichaceae bacterium]MDD4643082.1 AAC(3) family N-acetyltransferase [Erysipelotrichaceae bacterium]
MDLLKKTIEKAITKGELVTKLKELGVKDKMVLETHIALSSFGYVIGGAQAVVNALIETIGYEGTLVMPLQDANNCDPTIWETPAIDHELHQIVRDNTPAFDKKESDGVDMGVIVENFRRRDGAIVSNNPSLAYVARGKYAKLICDRHPLHFSLGEDSPISRLYDLDAYVLLIGVPFSKCTCLHLAEYRSGYRPIVIQGAAVEIKGKRIWKKYLDIDLNSTIFNEIGLAMENQVDMKRLLINDAQLRLFSVKEAIDFAVDYLKQK